MKNIKKLWKRGASHEPTIAISAVLLFLVLMVSFEQVTGVSASVRGTPVYGAPEMPATASSSSVNVSKTKVRPAAIARKKTSTTVKKVPMSTTNTLWQGAARKAARLRKVQKVKKVK